MCVDYLVPHACETTSLYLSTITTNNRTFFFENLDVEDYNDWEYIRESGDSDDSGDSDGC